jgi:hypothetical protein
MVGLRLDIILMSGYLRPKSLWTVHFLSLTSKVRFPCRRHENNIFLNKEIVILDLFQFGFISRYEMWEHHGEVVFHLTIEEEENMM